MKMADLLKNKALIWSIVGVVILAIGIIVALQLIPQPQDVRQKAATSTGTTQIKIAPTTMQLTFNEQKTATVQVNTLALGVRGMSAVLSYPYTGSAPNVTASDLVLAPQFTQAPWTCDLKNISTENQQVIVTVSCRADAAALPNGFKTNSQFVDFFTFKLKAGTTATTTPLTITFNNQETIMTTVDTTNDGQDVAAIPTTNLKVTVAAGTNPPPAPGEKKITVTAPSLTCNNNEFSVSAEVAEGTTKKSGVTVTFKYNNETKTATTDAQGKASVNFTKAATTQNVTAEAEGYTAGSAAATLPTNCDSNTGNRKTLDLSLSGLGCGASDFTANVTAHDPDATNMAGIGIVFTYNGQTKNATTNSVGFASVPFNRAGSNMEIKVSAGAFEDSTRTVELPTGCSSSTTSGSVACNGTCTASRDCGSGLSCISGYCRDSRCSSDTTCGCSDVNVASQSGTTQLPESGFDQTLALSVLGFLFLLGGAQLWWSHSATHVLREEEEEN